MAQVHPREVPHFDRPHHACPLGAGWWRGPPPRTGQCERYLRELGVAGGGELPDGSFRYRLAPDAEPYNARLAAADPDAPEPRAHWIAARLQAARLEMEQPAPRPTFMAVFNLTPDSFSDGGSYRDPEALSEAVGKRVQEGAAWLDLGAESTRPGAQPVPPGRQIERLLPALSGLRGFQVPFSIDTRSAEVARAGLDAGALMINDVSGLSDPEMGVLVAERGCSAVLVHMRGDPADMYRHAAYRFLIGEVADELAARVGYALSCGIRPEQIVLDPGIGFAKTSAHSLELIGSFGAFRALGFPLLAGPSRKSFLNQVLGERPPQQRDGGTCGAAALCAAQGAAILRLHRGGEIWDAVLTAWAAAGAARGGAAVKPAPAERRQGASA